MVIVLGNINDEPNKLNKTITNVVNINGVLRQETSVITPTILIEAENLSEYNYMYINSFGRYYFITDITSVKNGLWSVSGKVDVLMSFKDGINNCPIILTNTETSHIENYLPGDIWRTLVKSKTDIINFSSGLNSSGEYILITSGG